MSTVKLSKEFSNTITQLQNKFPQLTSAQEVQFRTDLSSSSKAKRETAKQRLVFGSVSYILKRVLGCPQIQTQEEVEDTVMEILRDMLENAEKYNPTYNTKFISYMERIISDDIGTHATGLSKKDRQFISKYNEAQSMLSSKNKKVSEKELADYMGVAKFSTIKNKISAIKNFSCPVSLDTPKTMDKDTIDMKDYLEASDYKYKNPEDEIVEKLMAERTKKAILSLPKREMEYLKLNLDLDGSGENPLSARKIAELSGKSRTTVSNVINTALAHVQELVEDKNFAA